MKNPELRPWVAQVDGENPLWKTFAAQEKLAKHQLTQFQHYYALLVEWNERINLTRIITLPDVLNYHFSDSLRFGDCIADTTQHLSLVDVGTGAGFPGIPLAIKYPHFTITLLEVTNKKVLFLKEVIQALQLEHITVDTHDWRTYLHHNSLRINYVCARASLQVPELMRIFDEGAFYMNTQVVYWASHQWEMPPDYKPLLLRDYGYDVGEKKRRLIFLRQPSRW